MSWPRPGIARCAVLGQPIAHSKSPVLHRAAYAALGLTDSYRYDAFEVDEPGLAQFLARLGPEWVGLSLTMPLKRAIIEHLDEISDQASRVNAVNTVLFDWTGPTVRLRGDNTDVDGIRRALVEAGEVTRRAGGAAESRELVGCVLGGGATAASAIAGISQLDARITTIDVVARRPQVVHDALAPVAAAYSRRLRVHPWPDAAARVARADVVVSTVPSTAGDEVAGGLERAQASAGRGLGVLLDVIYDPWPTPLAQIWSALGGACVGGRVMLLHQAARQVEQMTECPSAPVDAMRAALALADRQPEAASG